VRSPFFSAAGAASSEYAAPLGLRMILVLGAAKIPRRQRSEMARTRNLKEKLKPHLQTGEWSE
jgi:hypothetical protein